MINYDHVKSEKGETFFTSDVSLFTNR